MARPAWLYGPLLSATLSGAAQAFEPFTHNYTADQARLDAIDGYVTIEGRDYAVDTEVAHALRTWPSYYDAGVIGPDIYPDLLYGWNLIHTSDGGDLFGCETKAPDPPAFVPGPDCARSGDTGAWLRLVLEKAWGAQDDPSYTAAERAQILAFAYGFLTHAAGDLWAHTLVNDFAQELWPPLGDVLTDREALAVALRHKAVEAYVGDATPFYDGNPDRTRLPDGDISDVATPSRHFDAPHRFLYETFIAPGARTPAPNTAEGPAREATLGFFLRLRARLVEARSDFPRPVADAFDALIDRHEQFNQTFVDADEDCSYTVDFEGDVPHDIVACPIALASIATVHFLNRVEYVVFRDGVLRDSAEDVLSRYLQNWIARIDAGLEDWGELSLALNRAYFDPQVRRDLQNQASSPGCGNRGADSLTGPRADCESAVATSDVILHATDDFVNAHLLGMLGAPPQVGRVREIRQSFQERFDATIGPLIAPALLVANPLISAVDSVRDDARARIREQIEERFGIDVDDLEEFSHGAAHWLEGETLTITAPRIGTQTFAPLFEPGDHAQIDALTGLAEHGDHHAPSGPNGGGLDDGATFDPAAFAPIRNTIVLAKLLLLGAPELDRALGDMLAAQGVVRDAAAVRTYREIEGEAAPGNVMIDALSGTPWLRSITSDHAWRVDAQGELFGGFGHVRGGTGQFPLWESCLLRPTFRTLFRDWENPSASFPDLGDVASVDPSEPAGPAIELGIEGRHFDDGTTHFLDRDHVLLLATSDTSLFTDEHVALRWRAYAEGGQPGEFTVADAAAELTLTGPDGPYVLEYQSHDPCHTFENEDAAGGDDPLPPGALYTAHFTLARVGTAGNDRLLGSRANDILVGLGGADLLRGEGGNDELHGGPGDDLLQGGEGDDLVFGDDGNDRLVGAQGNDELHGGEGNDDLRGEDGDDVLFGDAGDDALSGGARDDVLRGGPGRDRLRGLMGADRLFGEEGDDRLNGGPDADDLDGGPGSNRVEGGGGDDRCRNGSGLAGCEARL
jgi:hypothetical protein